MTTKIACLRCAHVAEVPGDGAPDGVLRSGIFRCNECSARMSYGVLMPRIVINVEPPHFVTLTIDGVTHKLDAQFAALLATDILSVAVPR